MTVKDAEAAEANSPTLTYALSVIEKLTPAERQILISEVVSKYKEDVLASAASAASPDGVLASAVASAAASAVGSADSPSSVTNSSETSIGSTVSVGNARDITSGNITKNFAAPSVPKFKVGDRVKAKHPDIYGLPGTNELTIVSIDGDKAIVTFDGCRSVSGVDVPLSDLEPVEE